MSNPTEVNRDGIAPAAIAHAKTRGLVGPALYALTALLAFALPLAA